MDSNDMMQTEIRIANIMDDICPDPSLASRSAVSSANVEKTSSEVLQKVTVIDTTEMVPEAMQKEIQSPVLTHDHCPDAASGTSPSSHEVSGLGRVGIIWVETTSSATEEEQLEGATAFPGHDHCPDAASGTSPSWHEIPGLGSFDIIWVEDSPNQVTMNSATEEEQLEGATAFSGHDHCPDAASGTSPSSLEISVPGRDGSIWVETMSLATEEDQLEGATAFPGHDLCPDAASGTSPSSFEIPGLGRFYFVWVENSPNQVTMNSATEEEQFEGATAFPGHDHCPDAASGTTPSSLEISGPARDGIIWVETMSSATEEEQLEGATAFPGHDLPSGEGNSSGEVANTHSYFREQLNLRREEKLTHLKSMFAKELRENRDVILRSVCDVLEKLKSIKIDTPKPFRTFLHRPPDMDAADIELARSVFHLNQHLFISRKRLDISTKQLNYIKREIDEVQALLNDFYPHDKG